MKRTIFCAVGVMLVVSMAAAETGPFTSFSTTVTQTGEGEYDFDLLLSTAGAGEPQTDDAVFFLLVVAPVVQPIPPNAECYTAFYYLFYSGTGTNGGTDTVYRGDIGNTSFGTSFSLSGIDHPVGHKWSAWAVYGVGSPDTIGSTTTYSMLYFLYYTVCPWLTGPTVTAGSVLWNITDTTGTDTGIWRQGIIIGSIMGTGAPVPALGTWGLLLLGVLLSGTGVFIMRRA